MLWQEYRAFNINETRLHNKWQQSPSAGRNKYRLKRKEKNKSREEIFYQMKVFFC